MSFDLPTLESQGEGETISQQEAEAKILEISDIQTHIQKITQNQDPDIRERLKNAGLQDEVLQFISNAANNNLDEHSHEYSKEKFDTDGEDGLDSFEFKNFSDSLSLAIEQIVILDGIGIFNEIQKDSDYSGWYSPDKKLSEYADFQELFLGDDEGSSFSEEALNRLGVSDGELHEMAEKPFDITSSDSWGEMGILLVKELGDGVEDILRFMGNIPAGAILLPRYLSYRIDINSSDPVEAVEGEIKIQELVADNPSLGILDLLGEKGVDMIKHLAAMLISGKQGDIAMTLVTIAGLLAGGAGAVKLGARATNMSRVERVAGNIQRGAQRVDDIVGGAGIGHMTGSFKEPQATNTNISPRVTDTPEIRNTPQTNTTLETPTGDIGLSEIFSSGDAVIVPRYNGSTSQGQIVGFNGDKAIVEWTENGQTLTKSVGTSKLQKITNVAPDILQDILSLNTGSIIELKNGSSGYVLNRVGDVLTVEITQKNGDIHQIDLNVNSLTERAGQIQDIVRYQVHEVNIPSLGNIDQFMSFIRSMKEPGIMGGEHFFTKGQLLTILQDIKGGNLKRIEEITSSSGLRQRIWESIPDIQKRNYIIPHLWPNGIDSHMSQGNIGNCYFIASLRSIKSHPEAKNILSRMISLNSNGSVTVRFPGDIHQRAINITKEQLAEMKQVGGVRGSLGDKIIERAYARLVREQKEGVVDGEYSGKTIIGVMNNGGNRDKLAMEGGQMYKALKEMFGSLGREKVFDSSTIMGALNNIDETNKGSIILSLGSRQKVVTNNQRVDSLTYVAKDAFGVNINISHGHAYGIEDVDIINRRLLVVNPHDTQGKRFWMTYEQIEEYFPVLQGLIIDRNSLLRSLEESDRLGNDVLMRSAA